MNRSSANAASAEGPWPRPRWRIDASRQCLEQVTFQASPNQDTRPLDTAIDLVVVHCIALPPGSFGGGWIGRFFANDLPVDEHPYFAEIADLRVSAHLLIDRHGEVTQFVPFDRRAWHAGESAFGGRSRCNDFSIGIEMEGCDDGEYTQVQYDALAGIGRALMAQYPDITPERFVGHSDIAPGRKTDPGHGFDWSLFLDRLEYDA